MSIKCAEQSPRICTDGSIHWYQGDTFELVFNLTLKDNNGNVITVEPDDKINICFKDKYENIVYEFETTGTTTVEMCFDQLISEKFSKGIYWYCVRYKGEYITTVMHRNKVVVE